MKMLMNTPNSRACPWGCCTQHPHSAKGRKAARRMAKRQERQATRKFLSTI